MGLFFGQGRLWNDEAMISITAPIQPALDHVARILFRPFSWQKWFVLGFCAFLVQLGEGGSYSYHGHTFDHTPLAGSSSVAEWMGAHLPLVITLGAFLLLLILALTALFLWLSSRGAFLFLDGVARNRAAVVEPWGQFRSAGNQLFRFRLVLFLVFFGCLGLCAGAGFLFVLPALRAQAFGHSALIPLLIVGGILTLGALAYLAVALVLMDFVVPIMYRRSLDVGQAWHVFLHELLPGHAWRFVGFYLMTLLLWVPALVLAILTICLTCCVAILPYLSSVALLPITVFFRCYSLCFLEQFGEEWRIIEVEPAPAS